MTDEERERMREYVKRWTETGAILEKLRREEIRSAKLEDAISIFDDAFRSALWLNPAEKTSGLIEFHKIMAKSR
jgi:hypothetical protein